MSDSFRALRLVPCSISDAKRYVARWHRHHEPCRSALFALGAQRDGELDLCGVAIVGRPKARGSQDGRTCEVVRLATPTPEPEPRTPEQHAASVCSFLYARARRASQALGYTRCLTYTLARESGASLRALGIEPETLVPGRSWSCASRPRTDKHPTEDKLRWAI